MTIREESKLKEIDNAIRWHYFDDDCKHENYDKCCANIVSKIIKITQYKKEINLNCQ